MTVAGLEYIHCQKKREISILKSGYLLKYRIYLRCLNLKNQIKHNFMYL